MSIKEEKYLSIRNNKVTKANTLIQESRFNLSVQQQKLVLFLISHITPYDDDFKVYEFSVSEFCKVLGINFDGGKTYVELKRVIKETRDQSVWMKNPEGVWTTMAWIEKPYIDERSGMIQIRLDKDMKPFLLQLKENFTSYELIYTLRMRSKYSIRLYELIKSIHYHELDAYKRRYTIEELQELIGATTYEKYKDFHMRALKPAVEEINLYTDKVLAYETVTRGKKVLAIEFTISSKDALERVKLRQDTDQALGCSGQITFWEVLQRDKK